MRRVILHALATVSALGLIGAAVAPTVDPMPAGEPVAGATVLVDRDVVVPDDSELATLGALASEQAQAERDADAAAVLLDEIKAERSATAERVSRDAERVALEQAAAAAAAAEAAAAAAEAAAAAAAAEALTNADPRGLGQSMAADRGWSGAQWSCLESLWQRESNWDPTARNPSSGAFGIPQSLPGSKMATAGSDWETNPATQIAWGLGYIGDRYGTPCSAWAHSEANNWY